MRFIILQEYILGYFKGRPGIMQKMGVNRINLFILICFFLYVSNYLGQFVNVDTYITHLIFTNLSYLFNKQLQVLQYLLFSTISICLFSMNNLHSLKTFKQSPNGFRNCFPVTVKDIIVIISNWFQQSAKTIQQCNKRLTICVLYSTIYKLIFKS